jgi:hypothetical protein
MNTTPCRECRQPVSLDTVTCPECGAPRPAQSEWHGEGYEYKSALTWMNSPLLHVAFGIDKAGKVRTARGIVAVGQRAVGVVACGIIATGVVAIGVISLGIISLGVISVALGAAFGVNAIAPIAFGVTSFGFMAGGLAPVGWRPFFH